MWTEISEWTGKTVKSYVLPKTKPRNLLGNPWRSRSLKSYRETQAVSHAFLACKTWLAPPAIGAHTPRLATTHLSSNDGWAFENEPLQGRN